MSALLRIPACIRSLIHCVQALSLSGQKLFGVPIIVQPTMAEKNRSVLHACCCTCVEIVRLPTALHRLAAQAQNLKKAEGPKKLYVGSLHYNINEAMLKAIFEPFGAVEKIQIMKDETGLSKGYGFVEVSLSLCHSLTRTHTFLHLCGLSPDEGLGVC